MLGRFAESGKVSRLFYTEGKKEAQRQSEKHSTEPKNFNYILIENYTPLFQGFLYLYTVQQHRSTA